MALCLGTSCRHLEGRCFLQLAMFTEAKIPHRGPPLKLFSFDGLSLVLALVLAVIPVWVCILEKRLPPAPEYATIFLAAVLLGLTFYSSSDNAKKLNRAAQRIVSLSAEIQIDFTWPADGNPLPDNGNDGSQGLQEVFWLSTPNSLIRMYSISGYEIVRTGSNTAQFKTKVAPKVSEE